MSPAARLATKFAAGRRLPLLLAALGAGAIAALGQAPVDAWGISLIGFAVMFGLFRAAPDPRRAGLLGWAAGTGYFLVALHWIVEPFFVDAARHAWMAPFALLFMAGGLALFWSAALALANWAGGTAIAFAAALTLAEAARGALFTGFPWAQPGHIWIGTPLMPLAAFAGALGLTVITFAVAALIWREFCGRLLFAGATVVLLIGLNIMPYTPPAQIIPEDAPTIRVIQPNAAQHEKWDPDLIPVFFRRQMEYTSAAPRPNLIVWPETAIPVLLNNAAPTLEAIAQAAGGTPVVLGAQRLDGVRLHNSLVLTGPAGQIDAIYDKHHLVPFGEYIPFGSVLSRFGLRGMAAKDGNGYSSGPGPQIIDMGPLGRALPLICYEGVFPYDVARAPERADFMLLITNDAWFGQLSGPYQHFAQARLRSVEQGLPMVRAANTGISAVIDGQGHVLDFLPLGEAGYLDSPLPPPLEPTIYSNLGDLPVLLILLVALGGAFLVSRRVNRLSD